MQNNKMLLFFEVKPPCFEVFLGYEFIWLAFLYFPPHCQYFKHTVCVCIYLALCIHTYIEQVGQHSQPLGLTWILHQE